MAYAELSHWQVYDDAGRRKYLSGDERRRFMAAARLLPAAGMSLCHTLALTGCRISEALTLARYQLDSERCTLTFRTLKQRRTIYRTVPVPEDLVKLLAALPARQDERLWTMHRSTAWRMVKATMEAARIAGPMACCKGLRHGFGMHAASKNVPPNLIQRWMGHSSSATTAIYLNAVGLEERAFARRMWC